MGTADTGMTPSSAPIAPEVMEALLAARAQFVAFVERRVGSRAAAEDIVQSAFVKGIERGGEIRDGESAVAWFYRVLRNAIIDHYRRGAAAAHAGEAWAREIDVALEPTHAEAAQICGCVSVLLTTLKPEYRSAIETVELAGRSLRELAQKDGISENNAAVRLHRARVALRQRVAQSCGACATHGCLDCTCGGSAK